jgi:tryptophan synthase alpha chain
VSVEPASLRRAILDARTAGRCAFIPYLTMGYPTLAASLDVLARLEALGCDAVEIGIPFSDPVADGPTIQHSIECALAQGVHLRGVLAALAGGKGRARLLFSYLNPLLAMGLEQLPQAMHEAGIGAALITDLSPEQGAAWNRLCAEAGIETCYLAAVTSDDARLARIAAASSGMVYCISTTGVTGARDHVDDAARGVVSRLRAHTELPIAVGFGIRRREDVLAVAQYADAVIVGSALLTAIGDDAAGAAQRAEAFVQPLLEACRA